LGPNKNRSLEKKKRTELLGGDRSSNLFGGGGGGARTTSISEKWGKSKEQKVLPIDQWGKKVH